MAPYEYIGNTIPAPGQSINNPSSFDQELKFSTAGYTQRGGTLKGGQGILRLGTVLARETTTKQWVKFVSGGTNGSGTAIGVLRKTTDTGVAGDGKFECNIAYAGKLKYNLVSSANGAQLSAAITALAARSAPEINLFSF